MFKIGFQGKKGDKLLSAHKNACYHRLPKFDNWVQWFQEAIYIIALFL